MLEQNSPKPKDLDPKMVKHCFSMFEIDAYSHILEERMKDVSHDVAYTEPGFLEEDSKDHPESVILIPRSVKIKYAKTYRLEPKNTFSVQTVERKMQQILKDKIHNMAYDPDACKPLTSSMANDILAAVKEMEFDRYKYIVQIFVMEKKSQGINISSRSLCNTEWDNYATAKYENAAVISIALMFAIYCE